MEARPYLLLIGAAMLGVWGCASPASAQASSRMEDRLEAARERVTRMEDQIRGYAQMRAARFTGSTAPEELPSFTMATNIEVTSAPAVWVFSPNNVVCSLLFDNLSVRLTTQTYGAKVAAIQLPIELADESSLLGTRVMVRGFVHHTTGTLARVFVSAGRESRVVDFPYEEATEPGREFVVDFLALESRGKRSEGGERPPVPPLTITVMVQAEKRSEGEDVLISVDSVDLALR